METLVLVTTKDFPHLPPAVAGQKAKGNLPNGTQMARNGDRGHNQGCTNTSIWESICICPNILTLTPDIGTGFLNGWEASSMLFC